MYKDMPLTTLPALAAISRSCDSAVKVTLTEASKAAVRSARSRRHSDARALMIARETKSELRGDQRRAAGFEHK